MLTIIVIILSIAAAIFISLALVKFYEPRPGKPTISIVG